MYFMRNLKPIKPPVPLLKKEKQERRQLASLFFESDTALPAHGFVMGGDTSSLGRLLKGVTLTELFSDHVLHIAPGLFYGSLAHTFSWFGSNESLSKEISKGIAEQDEPFRVVAGPNFLRSLFYALSLADGVTEPNHLDIINRENLPYRQFCQRVGWEEWSLLCSRMIDLLALRQSRRARYRREVESFTKQMRTMRFRRPFEVPHTLSGSELSRRFGSFVADIWSQWLGQGEMKLQLAQLPIPLDPARFTAHSSQLFPEGALVSIDKAPHLIAETFFLCLETVKTMSTPTHLCGLRDFQISIVCSAHITIKKSYNLSEPIFERSPKSESILRLLCERERGAMAQENLVPEWVEKVFVTPGALYTKRREEDSIFILSCNKPIPLEESAFDLALLDRSRVSLYSLADTILPENSVITKASFNASSSLIAHPNSPTPCTPAPLSPQPFPPHSSFETGLTPTELPTNEPCAERVATDIFRHAHRERPLMLLRKPAPLTSFHANPACGHFRFSEVVENDDYFIFRSNRPYAFWVRSPATQRELPTAQRTWMVVGLFLNPSGTVHST